MHQVTPFKLEKISASQVIVSNQTKTSIPLCLAEIGDHIVMYRNLRRFTGGLIFDPQKFNPLQIYAAHTTGSKTVQVRLHPTLPDLLIIDFHSLSL
jgi:hypothetical protein